MRFLVLVTLSASFAAASAQDPKSEIIERVVDRCNLSTLAFERYSRNIHFSKAELYSMATELRESEHTRQFIENLMETVSGLDAEARQRLYDIAYVECFLAGVKEPLQDQ